MAARSIYKARLCLDTLELPVKFYSAVEKRAVHFRLLHAEDREPVAEQLIDLTNEQPVDRSEVYKAYPTEDHRLVQLEPAELAGLEPEASRNISLSRFVDPNVIDHRFYDRPYYLGPDGEEEDYFALCRALSQKKYHGLVHWVMRKRAYVGALREQDGYLMIVTLRHLEEVLDVGAIASPEKKEVSPQEIQLARQLVDALKGPFDPNMFQDDYRARLETLIARKASGKVIDFPAPKKLSAPRKDLTDALKNSLRKAKKKVA